MLGALALLLGNRADLNSLKNPKHKCVIEGVFSLDAYQLKSLFQAQDIDYESETIIRREIWPSGKSRAFVNDSPVKLKQLAPLGKQLVDIHSQHETLFVGNSDYQYQVIDALADNAALGEQFKSAWTQLTTLQRELEQLKQRQQEAQKTYDYHCFLLDELQEANLEIGMQTALETRFEQLSNVEELKESLSAGLQQVQQEDFGTIEGLQTVKNQLVKLENYGQAYQQLSERMKSVLIEVEDMAVEMERLYDDIENDPEALAGVNEKLQVLYSLQKKHNRSTVKDLLTLQAELEEKVGTSERAEAETAALERRIEQAEKTANALAEQLCKRRKNVLKNFENAVEQVLLKLGMADARLKITLDKSSTFNAHGKDEMSWQFSANKGGRFQEMRKSASGGELSRITLAIKSILAQYSHLPTIIFDEIDTGVSGEIAQKMGDIMSEMGQNMQVISITHLPQIAAKGKQHFKVYKTSKNNDTQTIILKLSTAQRIDELAEMLGGKEKSASAIAHAKSLLN